MKTTAIVNSFIFPSDSFGNKGQVVNIPLKIATPESRIAASFWPCLSNIFKDGIRSPPLTSISLNEKDFYRVELP
ncbi:hypothetical protein [Ruegeria sp. Alg231-54]|uniref:hypothetical protein n=1 Tax=Ruegeria sp. Alg231-54 TaxID=1922221 RepID=UPI00131F151A|nr:hypothetical protein [Ruegeria sp. Alg231-54]